MPILTLHKILKRKKEDNITSGRVACRNLSEEAKTEETDKY